MDSENENKWVVCRTCLKPGTEMEKIFEDTEQNLAAKIEECGSVVLAANVDLPDSICKKCLTLLRAAIKFRSICQRTQSLLFKQFGNEPNKDDKEEQDSSESFPEEFLKFKKKEIKEDIQVEQEFAEEFPATEVVMQETNLLTSEACVNAQYKIEYEPQDMSSELNDDSITTDEVGFELVKDKSKSNDFSEQEQEMVEFVLQIDGDQANNFKIIPQVKKKSTPANPIEVPALPIRQKRKYKSVQVFENADGQFECPKCDNVYYTKHKLILHLKMHNQDKPHECEICLKRFAQTPQLARHMNTHTGQRPFQCTFCPASFADPSTRIKHIRTHTNERPYKCEVCNKSFTYSNVLKVHQMIHTGEKPYSCRHCGKKFSQSHHRKNHERTHSAQELGFS